MLNPRQSAQKSGIRIRRHRLVNGVVVVGVIWGLFALALAAIAEPTPENWTLLVSIAASGLYTIGLYLTRRIWLPRLARRPLRNAILLGIFNAAVIETVFLAVEKLMGAEGVAAHPNLLIDLVMTLPWYAMLVVAFVGVQHRQRFSPAVVLLLGALYELGADGVAGPLVGMLFGDFQLLTLEYWLLLMLFGFWAFIPVYSSILLPPAWLIETTPHARPPSPPAWRDALKPLIWLIPFLIYLLILFLFMGALNLA